MAAKYGKRTSWVEGAGAIVGGRNVDHELTQFEQEVNRLAAMGLPAKEIASQLGCGKYRVYTNCTLPTSDWQSAIGIRRLRLKAEETNHVVMSQLKEVVVRVIPDTDLVELGIVGQDAEVMVELTANQAEELAELLRPAAADARRDGP